MTYDVSVSQLMEAYPFLSVSLTSSRSTNSQKYILNPLFYLRNGTNGLCAHVLTSYVTWVRHVTLVRECANFKFLKLFLDHLCYGD